MTPNIDAVAQAPATRSKSRWAISLALGSVLFLLIVLSSTLLPVLIAGAHPPAGYHAATGLVQALLVPVALALALRLVGWRLGDIGLTHRNWRSDVPIGLVVAVVFAIIQFALIIPATGGATRSDVAVNSAQIGHSLAGVAAFVLLAWTGSLTEELFFRGHFLSTLEMLLGGGHRATAASVVATTLLFAALHGYQGVAGVIDTGLYGGLGLTLLYLWRGRRLTAGIVAHAGWNTLATIGIYLWY